MSCAESCVRKQVPSPAKLVLAHAVRAHPTKGVWPLGLWSAESRHAAFIPGGRERNRKTFSITRETGQVQSVPAFDR